MSVNTKPINVKEDVGYSLFASAAEKLQANAKRHMIRKTMEKLGFRKLCLSTEVEART